MAVQNGKDLLLKVDNGGSWLTVAGLRSRRLAFNAETVDVTDAESAGRWRELLAGGGVKRAAVSGSGVFKDGTNPIRGITIDKAALLRMRVAVVPGHALVR